MARTEGANPQREGGFDPLRSPETALNTRLLRAFGLWAAPGGGAAARAAYRCYSALAYTSYMLFAASVLVQLWLFRTDLEQLTDNLSVTLVHAANITKMVPLLLLRRLAERPLRTLRRLHAAAAARGPEERSVLAASLRRVRRLSYAYVSLFVVTYTVWEATALARSLLAARAAERSNSTDRPLNQLPCRGWYPWTIQTSPNYELSFALQSVGFFYTVTSVSSINLFYFALVIHASTQFRALCASLGALRARARAQAADSDPGGSQRLASLLRDCIQHHQGTLQYADEVRRLLEPLMFTECMTMSIQLCVLIFQATSQPLTSPLFLSELSFLMCEMTQLFLYCYFGSELLRHSLAVAQAAYGCGWYGAPPSLQRSVALLMARAQRPSSVRALSFSTVSLELFTGLLKGSYSYYTLLRQVHEEPDELEKFEGPEGPEGLL